MKRRNFVKTSASALTAAAGFSIIPSTVLGRHVTHTARDSHIYQNKTIYLSYCIAMDSVEKQGGGGDVIIMKE